MGPFNLDEWKTKTLRLSLCVPVVASKKCFVICGRSSKQASLSQKTKCIPPNGSNILFTQFITLAQSSCTPFR